MLNYEAISVARKKKRRSIGAPIKLLFTSKLRPLRDRLRIAVERFRFLPSLLVALQDSSRIPFFETLS